MSTLYDAKNRNLKYGLVFVRAFFKVEPDDEMSSFTKNAVVCTKNCKFSCVFPKPLITYFCIVFNIFLYNSH